MKTILCYGDSNTYGFDPETRTRFDSSVRWTGRLAALLGDGYSVIEEGCNGRTACYRDENEPWKYGRSSFLTCLNTHKPVDVLILLLGINDCKEMFSPDAGEIAAAMRGYIEEAQRFCTQKNIPVPQIVLGAPAPLGEDITGSSPFAYEFTTRSREVSRKFAEEYRAVAEACGVHFFDAGENAEVSKADSLHLDAEGHRKLADALYAYIRKNIFETFDFTSFPDRRNKDALAVDAIGKSDFAPGAPDPGFDLIPMWVADMNFVAAPAIQDALRERIAHPLYGYYEPSKEYYDSIIRWQERRNGVCGLTREAIGYENGVLGGVSSALSALCSRGEAILLHSPVYIGFTGLLKNNGYRAVFSDLIQDEQGVWRMDYADMEEKIRKNRIRTVILCSPHNPCGRVWEREELEEAYRIFRKYDVTVISDEIWSDLILPGHQHIPSQSLHEDAKMRTAALYAPSKTFNLAGMIGSYHIIYNEPLRERIRKESSLSHYNSMNVLSMHALIGAYSCRGEEWLEALLPVLEQNVEYAVGFIRSRLSGISVFRPEGTYMLFIDCTEWCRLHGMTLTELERKMWRVGVAVQDGAMFRGSCHIRMNLALPHEKVREAFSRLEQYVFCDE